MVSQPIAVPHAPSFSSSNFKDLKYFLIWKILSQYFPSKHIRKQLNGGCLLIDAFCGHTYTCQQFCVRICRERLAFDILNRHCKCVPASQRLTLPEQLHAPYFSSWALQVRQIWTWVFPYNAESTEFDSDRTVGGPWPCLVLTPSTHSVRFSNPHW